MAIAAGGTHPTGMHSCTIYFQVARFELKSLQEVKSLEVAEFLGFFGTILSHKMRVK